MLDMTCTRVPSRLSGIGALVLGLLAGPSPLAAQSQTPGDTFQPWHSVMYRSVTAAELSPDGRQTLFLRSHPRRPLEDQSGAAWTELYLIDAAGREVPFITGEVDVAGATWIDDASIGFVAKRQGDDARALYRIATSGGEARKVFEHDSDISAFDLSPDGRWLAFIATDRKSEGQRTA